MTMVERMARTPVGGAVGQAVGWALVAGCVLYGVFAFAVAVDSLLTVLRGGAGELDRSAPPLFVVHAFSGGVALIAGAVQLRLAPWLLRDRRGVHRFVGRVYLWSAWTTSAGSLGVAAFFDVSAVARAVLGLGSVLWFVATTVAFARIRSRRVEEHREWMIRSFSLAFFFVTFSLWVPLFDSAGFPEAVGYPLAVFLSWSLNLAAAEAWIRFTRQKGRVIRAPCG
jgi:hypothetical protein